MQPARQQSQTATRSPRSRMIAAIHVTFKQVRRDLKGATEDEIREERLAFINDTLRLKRPVKSMRDCTDRQLGLVLDALKRFDAQPALPNSKAVPVPATNTDGAEIIHLASAEQVYAINKLFDHLGWDFQTREDFLKKKFKRNAPTMLAQSQAQSATMILLTIAASREIRNRGGVARVSRAMVRAELPAIKARLGLDRKPAGDGEVS